MPSGNGIGPPGHGPTGGGRGRGDGDGSATCRRRRDGSRRMHHGHHGHQGAGRGATATLLHNSPASLPPAGPALPVTSDPTSFAPRTRTVAVVAKPGSCIACGTCVESCPRGAITLDVTAVIDLDACTGCGLCVNDCSHGALVLVEV